MFVNVVRNVTRIVPRIVPRNVTRKLRVVRWELFIFREAHVPKCLPTFLGGDKTALRPPAWALRDTALLVQHFVVPRFAKVGDAVVL